MRSFFGALFTIGLFALSLPAHALKVAIENGYESTANIAIHYLKPDNVWHTEGWFVWQPHEQGFIEVDSNNTLFYIYVEFADGLVNNTNAGAVTQWVSDSSFSLDAGVKPETGARLVEFSLCNSDGHTAVVKLNPSNFSDINESPEQLKLPYPSETDAMFNNGMRLGTNGER